MKSAYPILIAVTVISVILAMMGLVVARMFFGVSHDSMLAGGGVLFVALLILTMLGNRLTYGVYIKRPEPEHRAVLDAGLKRAWLGYALGSVALLPVVFVLIRLGVDSDMATNFSVLAGAVVAAALFTRHMMRHEKKSNASEAP